MIHGKPNLDRRKWLVTGGCGFIGSHLVDALLARGDRVRVLDNLSTGRIENLSPKAAFVRGDVTDHHLVRRAMIGVDGCFHLAAIASVESGNDNWVGTHRSNLSGTIAVLDAARRTDPPTPVVYASSAAVYGAAGTPPLAESTHPSPLSSYGADKLGCELHARVARIVHGVPTSGLRFFNVFGPRQDPTSSYSGVISIFCERLRAGKGVTVHGDGGQTRDFVYVDDAVRAILLAMDRMPFDAPVLNVCTGTGTTILQLAKCIADQCGTRLDAVHVETRVGDVRASIGDPSFAGQHLGFLVNTSLDEGLRRTLASMPRPEARTPANPIRRIYVPARLSLGIPST
ncbi:MAG TPA: NAD-dependent epimerase/dehydratase family protein [Alphaproteobacteria bacterium]|nr:NAD-dependent epimerase/dehydratase family protein [Alphaproteobacteria bacterium]